MPSTATRPPCGIPNGPSGLRPLPHTLVLDLGGRYQVDGFRYLPRQDGNPNGTIAGYQFYVSDDGTTWGTAVAAGTLAANTTEKTVRFTAKTGRFVRLVALSEINGQPYTSAAELNFFGTAVVSTPTSSIIPQQQIARRVCRQPGYGRRQLCRDECPRRQARHHVAYRMVPADSAPAAYAGARSRRPLSGRWLSLSAAPGWQPQRHHCRLSVLRQ